MNQSTKNDFNALANRLSDLIQTKCNSKACWVSNNDTRIMIHGGVCRMIPHTAIVLIYRFAVAHNLLMFFDIDNGHFVLH